MNLYDYYKAHGSVITSGYWWTTYGEPGVFPRIGLTWDPPENPTMFHYSVIKEDNPEEYYINNAKDHWHWPEYEGEPFIFD